MSPFDSGFASQVTPATTMADLIILVLSDPSLKPSRRRDIVSSIKGFARILGLDLAKSPAALAIYRGRIAKVQLAIAGLSRKSWLNTLSNVNVAVRRYVGREKRRPSKKDLTPAWAPLQRLIKDDDQLAPGLSAVIFWGSREGIDPSAISDEALRRFYVFKRDETFCRQPEKVHRRTCKLWNKAVDRIPGWPQIRLTLPQYRDLFSFPWESFRPEFRADIEAWAEWAQARGLFNKDGPDRVLCRETVATRKEQIRRIASAEVKSGVPIEAITSLKVLFEPANFEAALRVYVARLGTENSPGLKEMLVGLVAIAKKWAMVDAETLACLKGFVRRAGPRKREMTAKNRATLRQVIDPPVLLKLLGCPRELAALAHAQRARALEAQRRSKNQEWSLRKAAIMFEIAFAIAFLLAIPLRLKNLQGLRLDTNFKYSRPDCKGQLYLIIPPGEVKNDLPIEFEVPDSVRQIFENYCRVHRPLLAKPDDPWVFPGATCGPKHKVTLRGQIKGLLTRHAGITLTPHQFRHLAAFLYLKRHPGAYAMVARLLGHKNLQTTYAYYSGLESIDAAKLYDSHLTELLKNIVGRSVS